MLSSSLSCSNKDDFDDKGFLEDEAECLPEMRPEASVGTGSVAELDLKSDEQLQLEIEKTFREITNNSVVGRIHCDEGR